MIEKRDDVWRVRIYWHGKYRCSDTFKLKKDAEAWERKQTLAFAMGTWISPEAADVTVADYVEKWPLIRPVLKPSAAKREQSTIRTLVLPKFGHRLLSSISPSEIKEWANSIVIEHSPSSARTALGFLGQLYEAAKTDGIVPRNPSESIKLPRVPYQEPMPLSHEQLWMLAAVMPSRDRLMALVMGYGGLRSCEAVAVRRSCLSDGKLRLSVAAVEVSGHFHLGTLKGRAARSVVLPATVAAELTAWAASLPDGDPLLFADRNGNWIRYGNWRTRVLTPALGEVEVPRITPHNLRDTAASLAIQAGASVATVSAMLGHKDPATTLRHYVGWWPDDLDNVARLLDEHARSFSENHQDN